jgi:hypothetical protein
MTEVKTKAELTAAQWQYADEVVRDMRAYVEMIASDHPHDDPFTEQLGKWCVALGVLGWEVLAGTIELVRSGKRRAAFALSRALIDYALRLRYYRTNAESLKEQGGEAVSRTQAAADWNEAHEQLIDSLKDRRFDLNEFGEGEIAELYQVLDRGGDAQHESIEKMLEVYDEDNQVRDECFIERGLRSSYLRGDQTAAYAILGDASPRNFSFDAKGEMDDLNVVLTAIWFALEIMYEFRETTGRNYAINVLGRKFFDIFEIE